MIALVAATLAVIALLGSGGLRVAVSDLALLESQQAAQRAAEAAVSLAAELVLAGEPPEAIAAALMDEATSVARANLSRVSLRDIVVERRDEPGDLAGVEVTLRCDVGGIAGPAIVTAIAAAGVPRPR